MNLIVISLVLGLLGFLIGSVLGAESFSYIFCFTGLFIPALYVLEKIYRSSKHNNQLKVDFKSTLDILKSNGILTDIEYEKAYFKFNQVKENTENRKKYDEGVQVIYELSQANIILEDEFNRKIDLLKTMYRQ